jgi:hypothetical protein
VSFDHHVKLAFGFTLPRDYVENEELRNDPVAYRKLFDEVKIEAALVKYVCFSFLH